jgi:hypothetical protein
MKIYISPTPRLNLFSKEMELVIAFCRESIPEILVEHGRPKPDRHLLLGLAQMSALAVEEGDQTIFEFLPVPISLRISDSQKEFRPEILIARTENSEIGVLTAIDKVTSRRIARELLRYMTSTIRLDVP